MDKCYHCDLPVPAGINLQVELLGKPRKMCCPGCHAVAESIRNNGLTDYYKFRTESAEKADEEDHNILQKLKYLDFPDIQNDFVTHSGDLNEIVLTIEGITCSACSWLIEKQLISLPGIVRINVNSSTQRAVIQWQSDQLKLSEIIQTIQRVGYKAYPFQSDNQEAQHKQRLKTMLTKIGLSGLMTMQVMMFAFALYFGFVDDMDATTESYFHWISLVLSLPVISYCSMPFYDSAWRSLKGGAVNMDVSISIAIFIIFIASVNSTLAGAGHVYFESICMFVFLLLTGRYMELKARTKAVEISSNMLKLMPLTANLEQQGTLETVPAKRLQVNDVIVVAAGETIAADGEVIDGSSSVNQAMLSGESDLISKVKGDLVFAGTINHDNPIKIRVNKPQQENFVSTILRLQEQANQFKPRIAEIADKISNYFVLGVIAVAILAALYWSNESQFMAIQVFVAVLVATCPCALSLATPVALTCAISRLNRAGILVRKANILQQLNDITHFMFDKTGTLTQGSISVTRTHLYSDINTQQALSLAASLEQYSEHPIATAFKDYPTLAATNVSNNVGSGIEATIDNQIYKIGKAEFVVDKSQDKKIIGDVFLSCENKLIASFTLEDTLREESSTLISRLQKDNYQCVILSGDKESKVSSVADTLNIKDFYSGLTPEQKLHRINDLKSPQNKVAMVGDGINDVPVLAAADVSFAVSEASDLSKQGADIILLSKSLNAINQSLEMARKSHNIIRQNFAWAIGYNALALPLAIFGVLTPWMAVIGMSASSILVISNSLRLNRSQL
jgi:Cu2+-exporting ATPase